MGCLFLIAILTWPIAELHVIYSVYLKFGYLPVVAALVVAAIIGSSLMRSPGRKIFGTARKALMSGIHPGKQLVATISVWFAGLLLLIPGFLSDILAILLLIPLTREFIFRQLFGFKIQSAPAQSPEDIIIEGEWEEVD